LVAVVVPSLLFVGLFDEGLDRLGGIEGPEGEGFEEGQLEYALVTRYKGVEM
jgi:hypothetical protein